LATKNKMLASTVQFSRYGRSAGPGSSRAPAAPQKGEKCRPTRAGPVRGGATCARSLRTQQRAWAVPPDPLPFLPPKQVY
jgi:hypothetical protein